MERITSAKNPIIQMLKGLQGKKGRTETGLMLVEGEKMIREAMRAGLTIEVALIAASRREALAAIAAQLQALDVRIYEGTDGLISAVSDTRSPQGVCAACRIPDALDLSDPPDRLVALDGVQDPGNVGTIWRTADAAGFSGLLLTEACADPFSPKVQRAAMGSGLRVPVSVERALDGRLADIKSRGFVIAAATLEGADIYAYRPPAAPLALVIGGEARGVGHAALALADVKVHIPMRGGAESLNAAVAAGIMMYQLMRNS